MINAYSSSHDLIFNLDLARSFVDAEAIWPFFAVGGMNAGGIERPRFI